MFIPVECLINGCKSIFLLITVVNLFRVKIQIKLVVKIYSIKLVLFSLEKVFINGIQAVEEEGYVKTLDPIAKINKSISRGFE